MSASVDHTLGDPHAARPTRIVRLSVAPRLSLVHPSHTAAQPRPVELHHGADLLVLGPGTSLTLTRGRFRSTLEISGRQVSLSPSKLRQALELLCVARLAPPAASWIPSPFVRPAGIANAALLAHLLAPGETLLAWVPLAFELKGHSVVVGQWAASAWLLLSDQRALCVAASDLGDVEFVPWVEDLPAIAAGVFQRLARLRRAEPDPSQVDPLSSTRDLTGKARILETARLCAIQGEPRARTTALKLLASPALANDEVAPLLRAWLELEAPAAHPLAGATLDSAALSVLADADLPAHHTRWQISIAASRRLLDLLPRDARYKAPALALSQALWQTERASAQEPSKLADADLSHAALLLDYDQTDQANALLLECRTQLPAPQLGDIELPLALQPSALRGTWQRVEALSLRAQGNSQHGRTKVLQRLLGLDPLNPEWLTQLSQSSEEPVASRARIVLKVVHGHGVDAASPGSASDRVPTPLSPEYLKLLPHPLIAPHAQTLTRVQTLLAKVQTPDFSTLKLYCERITKADSQVVMATDEAATLLGLGHLDVYISRGHDDVGCRAFSHQHPFILVGGQHLDPESRYYMPLPQLRFVIASELAHLRFKHVRVAPRDVLSGVLDKSKQGLDLALGILPLLKSLKVANRLGVLTAKLSLPQAAGAARVITQAVGKTRPPSEGRADISTANEELILAHRLMQLSADRAGLLACQSFEAASFALFRSRSDYVRGVSELEARGALPVAQTLRSGHPEAYDDLLTRLGALASFYVSDTYELLRASAHPRA